MNAPKDLFLTQAPSFQDFLRTRERISNDYINGHPGPLKDIATQQDPATFFPPSGTTVQGAAATARARAAFATAAQASSRSCKVPAAAHWRSGPACSMPR